jgi:hypothetical protein
MHCLKCKVECSSSNERWLTRGKSVVFECLQLNSCFCFQFVNYIWQIVLSISFDTGKQMKGRGHFVVYGLLESDFTRLPSLALLLSYIYMVLFRLRQKRSYNIVLLPTNNIWYMEELWYSTIVMAFE